MTRQMHFLTSVCAAALTTAVLFALTAPSRAQDVAPPGVPPEVELLPADSAAGQDIGYPPAADCCEPKCHYDPCIKYHGERRLKRFCCECGPANYNKVALEVADPARCGCAVEVPICLPTCCQGDPCVKSRCSKHDRGVVWYKWCCGYKVRVVFRGDDCEGRKVSVTYFTS